MSITIIPQAINFRTWKTNALLFYPSAKTPISPAVAVFTHGYTSHKGSLLSWASRLVENGVPTAIFDLPGHFLGSINHVKNFKEFTLHAHELFFEVYNSLQNNFLLEKRKSFQNIPNVVLGGHSLGALLALKALGSEHFSKFENIRAITVGLGLSILGDKHLFDMPLYKSVMDIRKQLISKELAPENMFPWIDYEKRNLKLKNKNIHMITGIDDLVVKKQGTELLKDILEENGNQVSLDIPKSLPHHLPENAASYIKSYLKKNDLLSASF